jgi:3D (Asp-Asp-Asp) domain-containing protein
VLAVFASGMLLSGASVARAVQAERMNPAPLEHPLVTALVVTTALAERPGGEPMPESAPRPDAPAVATSVAPPNAASTTWAPAALLSRRAGSGARQLNVQLTAYSASTEEGTEHGITASGRPARSGTVAVDPAIIPLGSQLRIAGLPGIYRAEDTGGSVHGAHVDVFQNSRVDALQFGRRLGVVEILE